MSEDRASCYKIAYDSRGEANKAIGNLITRKNNPKRGTKPESYQCEHCGKWHWGHRNKKLYMKRVR